jgi:hypothetical protein
MKEKGKSMRLGTGQAVLAHLMDKWFADIHFKADFHLQPLRRYVPSDTLCGFVNRYSPTPCGESLRLNPYLVLVSGGVSLDRCT